MQFCLNLYGLAARYGDAGAMVRAARAAEVAGFDAVSVTDHVAIGPRTDRYPYGPWPTPPDFPWWEPMIALSVIAGATVRIGLTQGILVAPLRPAALLAKQAATLDQLSRGRVSLGVGYGWQREEFEACGVGFAHRREILAEQLQVMKGLWSESPFSFAGRFHRIESIHSRPGPWCRNTIPILLGVAPTERNLDWMCRWGDGWLPISDEPEQFAADIPRLRAGVEDRGRDPAAFEVRVRLRTRRDARGAADLYATLEQAHALARVGVSAVELYPIEFLGPDPHPGFEELIARCGALIAQLR